MSLKPGYQKNINVNNAVGNTFSRNGVFNNPLDPKNNNLVGKVFSRNGIFDNPLDPNMNITGPEVANIYDSGIPLRGRSIVGFPQIETENYNGNPLTEKYLYMGNSFNQLAGNVADRAFYGEEYNEYDYRRYRINYPAPYPADGGIYQQDYPNYYLSKGGYYAFPL